MNYSDNHAESSILSGLDEAEHKLVHLSNRLSSMGDLVVEDQRMDESVAGIEEDWLQMVFDITWDNAENTIISIDQLNESTGPFDLVYITSVQRRQVGGGTPDYELRIRENFQGKFMQHRGDFVFFQNVTGTAQLPYYVKGRRRFRPNSNIEIEFRPLDSGTAIVQLVLHGIKVMNY